MKERERIYMSYWWFVYTSARDLAEGRSVSAILAPGSLCVCVCACVRVCVCVFVCRLCVYICIGEREYLYFI